MSRAITGMVGSADCRNRYSCMQVTPCNRKYPRKLRCRCDCTSSRVSCAASCLVQHPHHAQQPQPSVYSHLRSICLLQSDICCKAYVSWQHMELATAISTSAALDQVMITDHNLNHCQDDRPTWCDCLQMTGPAACVGTRANVQPAET